MTLIPRTNHTDPSAAWRSLTPERRAELRRPRTVHDMTPSEARAAVAHARRLRRWATQALCLASLVIFGLTAGLIAFTHIADYPRSFVLGATTAVICVFALAIPIGRYRRRESRYLAISFVDETWRPASPLTLTGRFPLAVRILGAVVAAVALMTLVVSPFIPSVHLKDVVYISFTLLFLTQQARAMAWPIASSYPVVGRIDESGVTLDRLDLVVPWSDITAVSVEADAVYWLIRDPYALVAASSRSPRHKRLLTRWVATHRQSLCVRRRQMRESVDDVYRTTVRYRQDPAILFRHSAKATY